MPYTENDGTRIWYEVDGSGAPLLLHPGFVGSLEDWDDAGYVSTLREQYRIIRLDPRGQGHSDAPHDPAAYALRHRVGDVLAILNTEGIERAHFWGYSMGGGIGLTLGRVAPQRLRALVLGAPSPFHEPGDPSDADGMLDDLQLGMTSLVSKWEAAVTDLWLSDGERARWLAADAEALAAARIQRLKEPYITKDDLAGIPTATLVYAGTNDSAAVLETLERAARLMPNAEVLLLEGLNHAQVLTRSDLILPRVLKFLERADLLVESRP